MASRSSIKASTSNSGQTPGATQASDDEERRDDIAVTLRQSVSLLPCPVLYTRRYAMLAMFAGLGFLQCAVWNTWGPIASTAQQAYPAFTTSNIATLAIWGPVTCLSGTLICTMLIQKRGLRQTMIISTFMMAAGTSLRCISQDPDVFLITAHVGAILNGFAGVLVGIAPALVSSLWFPVSFRTTATSIGCTFNQLGNAGGFFLGPYMVQSLNRVAKQQREEASLQNAMRSSLSSIKTSVLNASHFLGDGLPISLNNLSSDNLTRTSFVTNVNEVTSTSRPNFTLEQAAWNLPHGERLYSLVLDGSISANISLSPQEQQLLRHYVSNYMFVVAGICIALLILVVAYFEDEPPSPPTVPVVEILSRSGRSSLPTHTRSGSWRGRSTASRTDAARARPLTETLRLTVIPLRNVSFLVMLLAYSITLGINVAWSSMLEINLSPLGVSQQQSSNMNSVLIMDYMLVGQGVLVVFLLLFVKEEYRRSGPQKLEEMRSTMGRVRAEEDEESGYAVSDDSDEEHHEAPRVRLLADSSSEDGGHDNPVLNVRS
ncbi:Major facilitator superfamily domain [Trinorchestia longiramus]|nr:Major facilitator superfamily domain [Trinorchestia longiramus]